MGYGREGGRHDAAVRFEPGPRHACDLHAARGDGARLVEAERVHAGERLHAVRLLDEDLAHGEPRGRYGEDARGEKDESLGNHADDRRDGRENRIVDRGTAREERAEEESEPQGHEADSGDVDDRVERAANLGPDRLDVLRLGVDARRITFATHPRHLRDEAAGVHEAPGEQLAAGLLGDRRALAREEALVHGHASADHDGVGGHLVAVGETDEVIDHELRRVHLDAGTVANDRHGTLREDRELVDHALRANLLEDADGDVREHDAHEERVSPLLGDGDEHEHGEVHGVEERERVVCEDATDRLGLDVGVGVHPAVGDALSDLGGAQSDETVLDDPRVCGVFCHASNCTAWSSPDGTR